MKKSHAAVSTPRMKAIVVHRFGGPRAMKTERVARPTPRAGEMLIKINVAATNPVDTKIRDGTFKRYKAKLPAVIGRDVAGVVAAVPAARENGGGRREDGRIPYRVGDPVFGMLDYDRGAYAEYAVASPREVAKKPAGVTDAEAASLGVVGLTAWQGLFDHGKLKKGERVLIHGGAGGLGHLAVQFAKLAGATVIVTAGKKDRAWLKRLGADQVIDYRDERFEDIVGNVDLVFDLVAGETQERSWQALKDRGGRLISTLAQPSPSEARRHGAKTAYIAVHANPRQLTRMARLVADGKVKVHIGKRFPLAQAVRAHELIENGHVRGKVVLEVAG